ncbi:MAG TPA: amino acid adenylation domain-containing protein [Blastocatellia bacterium]|nr:amino acid adenylation domain-containing protein [Blastocatellia bacterium]
MSDILTQLAALPPKKRELLLRQLKKRADSATNLKMQTIPIRSRDGHLPLSFSQERLWLLDQIEPDSPAYNLIRAVSLEGMLDDSALEQSFNEIVRRHESLRTSFPVVEGRPVQAIAPALTISLPITDLQALSETERQAEIFRLCAEEVRRPFDLANGPVLRANLLRVGRTKHILILSTHHIVSDAWSAGVMIRELATLYEAFINGRPSPLPPLAVQYADFAVWQREWLQGNVLETQLSYWRQQLADHPSDLPLPADHPRPSVRSFRGATESFVIPAALTESLKALSQREGATLFMTLIATFKTLLYRYTQSKDIVIGSPIANRNRPEIEGLIGFFINTLVFRTDFSGDPTFQELLARVRKTCLEAFAHQDLPFERMVEELQPQRDIGRTPFFQVMFVLQNVRLPDLKLAGLDVSLLEVKNTVSKFDLTLNMAEGPEGIIASFDYSVDLFESSTISRMLRHLRAVLESVAVNPRQRLSEIPMLSDAERQQLLVEWNQTEKRYDAGRCIHHIFEAQAERMPDAVALAFEGTRLTYAELNRRANQLARFLIEKGVGPEVLVPICLTRSAEMIIGLLGILKAGGAYVPLDPSFPKQRLSFMLEDAAATLLVTQEGLRDLFLEFQGRTICLDSEWDSLAVGSHDNPPGRVDGEDLAYVIFTSGSTGRPKGVAVEHRQLVNYVNSIIEVLELPPGGSYATVSTLAADLGNTMVFPSLCCGGTLHVVAQERTTDPDALAEYFNKYPVDCLKIVPSHVAALIGAANPGRVLPRKRLILGGEASTCKLIRTLQSLAPDCMIFNHYGPTETTVGVLTYNVAQGGLDDCATNLPLGRPIRNTRAYILDEHLGPVPVGVAGDIYMGGAGVTRGYLNHPELTAEKFIPDPFGQEPGARVYRTGDLGRYLPNGNIEFLGRADEQVKIRGFRIELSEVESTLVQHPAIREAVAQVIGNSPADKQIVAYVVANQSGPPSVSELRGFLKERLPDYMSVSSFVFMEAIPLTANGKIDRRALPAPDSARPKDSDYVAPTTELEAILTGVWQEVLGVDLISIHDNFFALGGDSIRAIQIIHKAREYDMPITARDIFRSATIYEIARSISNGRRAEKDRPPLHLLELPRHILDSLPDDVEDAYPLSSMQDVMLYHYFNDHQRAGVYHCQLWFHIQDSSLSISALRQAIAAMVERHPALRTTLVAIDGEKPIQAVKKNVDPRIEEHDISGLSFEEQEAYVDAIVAEDRGRLFGINDDAPLIRFKLFKRSETALEFFRSTSHLVADGWGTNQFCKELLEFYLKIKNGRGVSRTPLPNSLKEFIALEKEIRASKEARDFWADHLRQRRPLKLRPQASGVGEESGGKVIYSLDSELAAELAKLANGLRVSLKTIFLSAYLDLIGEIAGQNVATVGVVSNGRTERLSEPFKSLGLFWNMAPFCCRVDFKDKLDQLKEVQRLLIDVEQFATYPLAQILEDQRETDLFFASFNYLHFKDGAIIPGDTGLKIIRSKGYDKFHYPLNYVVSTNPFDAGMTLRVEFDKLYFNGDSIRSAINAYVERLTRLAGAAERKTLAAPRQPDFGLKT